MEHTTFNGDHYIGEEIQKLVVRFNVQAIIETGTWSAHSTREFAKLAPQVFTIDATPRRLVTGIFADPYTFQMYQKMISDDYTDAELLLLVDSDLMVISPAYSWPLAEAATAGGALARREVVAGGALVRRVAVKEGPGVLRGPQN